MIEKFENIKGYEGLYQISNTGKVRSLPKIKGVCTTPTESCLLKAQQGEDGYSRIHLSKEGKKKLFYLHRLVAFYFVPNPENKKEVDHKNSDKGCNNSENLIWVTRLENEKKAWLVGEKASGERHQRSKEIVQLTETLQEIKRFPNAVYAAKELGFDRSVIARCARNVIKTAYGYKWMYI
jgi:hypothetical protein